MVRLVVIAFFLIATLTAVAGDIEKDIVRLLEEVKKAPPDERYKVMNELKLRLRELNERERDEMIRKIYHELKGKEKIERHEEHMYEEKHEEKFERGYEERHEEKHEIKYEERYEERTVSGSSGEEEKSSYTEEENHSSDSH